MSTKTTIIIQSNDDMSQVKVDTLSPTECATSLARYLEKLALSCGNAYVDMRVNEVGGASATGTITFSSMAAGATVTVGSQVFTCVSSGATGNQFNVGLSDTQAAANAAAAINANTILQPIATATSTGAVITLTAASTGYTANMIDLAISAHGSVSAAHMAGGVAATSNIMHLGL
jgi:phage tail sheath gpL-like